MNETTGNGLLFSVALVQGLFYIATGLWPLFSIGSFQKVTGPKVDLWLVKAVGALVTVVGAVILLAVWRGRFTPEVVLLAIGSAAVLTGIDVVYVSKRVISNVYLLDAVAETALIMGWVTGLMNAGA